MKFFPALPPCLEVAFDNFTYLVTYLTPPIPGWRTFMSDVNLPPTDALTEATQMVKIGRLDQAREILTQYLMKNPSSEQAWLLMSYVLSDPAKQRDCLERVLHINPNNTVAQSKLARLLGRRTEELFKKKVEPATPTPAPSSVLSDTASEPAPEISAIPEPAQSEPVPEISIPPAPAPPMVIRPQTEPVPVREKKPLFSGKWFRIIIVFLVVLIVALVGVILYTGVIGPAINALSNTPIPTTEPVNIPTYPPEWTQTPTPTETHLPPPTRTPTSAPSITPTETTIS
jgi:hypothetical protein